MLNCSKKKLNNLGSGKSSVVNLLLEESKAEVSDKAVGCTFNFQKYETPAFNLFDTVGLSEGSSLKYELPKNISSILIFLI